MSNYVINTCAFAFRMPFRAGVSPSSGASRAAGAGTGRIRGQRRRVVHTRALKFQQRLRRQRENRMDVPPYRLPRPTGTRGGNDERDFAGVSN